MDNHSTGEEINALREAVGLKIAAGLSNALKDLEQRLPINIGPVSAGGGGSQGMFRYSAHINYHYEAERVTENWFLSGDLVFANEIDLQLRRVGPEPRDGRKHEVKAPSIEESCQTIADQVYKILSDTSNRYRG